MSHKVPEHSVSYSGTNTPARQTVAKHRSRHRFQYRRDHCASRAESLAQFLELRLCEALVFYCSFNRRCRRCLCHFLFLLVRSFPPSYFSDHFPNLATARADTPVPHVQIREIELTRQGVSSYARRGLFFLHLFNIYSLFLLYHRCWIHFRARGRKNGTGLQTCTK